MSRRAWIGVVQVAVALVGVIIIVAIAPIDSDQRFTLWTTVVVTVGTVAATVAGVLIAARFAIRQALDDQDRRRDEELQRRSEAAAGQAVTLVAAAGEACDATERMHQIAHEWISRYGSQADSRGYIAKKYAEFDPDHRRAIGDLREFARYRSRRITDAAVRTGITELAYNIEAAAHQTELYTQLIVRGLVDDRDKVEGRCEALHILASAADELVDRLKTYEAGGEPKPLEEQPTSATIRELLSLPPWEVVMENMRKEFERQAEENPATGDD